MSIFRAVRAAHIEIDAMLEQAAGMNISRYLVLCVIGGSARVTRDQIASATGLSYNGVVEVTRWLQRQEWIEQEGNAPSQIWLALTEKGARIWAGARLAAIAVEQNLIHRIDAPINGIVQALTVLSTEKITEGSD
jgi:DNA-binding MarR family transcriptional regulator